MGLSLPPLPARVLLSIIGAFDPQQGYYELSASLGEAGDLGELERRVFRSDEAWAMNNWIRGNLADLAVINEHRHSNCSL